MALPIYISRNGVLIAPERATVSIFNPALYGAFGVYESMQVVQGSAFEQNAHLGRLVRSAELLGLPLPADPAVLGGWIADVLRANVATDCTLRLFALGSGNGGRAAAYIWPQPSPVYPETFYTCGATALTFEAQRYLPQAKSLNSLASYLAQARARAAGVHESLLHHDGRLTEGSNSNLFAAVDGVLVTPPTEQVLSGVTRDLVLALARAHDLPLVEADLPLAGLPAWQECFITSSSRHVMPITMVDGRQVGDGRVGPLTQRAAALFEAHFAAWLAHAGALQAGEQP